MRSLLLTMCVALGMSATAQTYGSWEYNAESDSYWSTSTTTTCGVAGLAILQIDNGDVMLVLMTSGDINSYDAFTITLLNNGQELFKVVDFVKETEGNVKGLSRSLTSESYLLDLEFSTHALVTTADEQFLFKTDGFGEALTDLMK